MRVHGAGSTGNMGRAPVLAGVSGGSYAVAMSRIPRWCVPGLAMVVMLFGALTPVVQAAPPAPSLRKELQPWMGIGLAVVLALVVLAVSIIPSKRGHQD